MTDTEIIKMLQGIAAKVTQLDKYIHAVDKDAKDMRIAFRKFKQTTNSSLHDNRNDIDKINQNVPITQKSHPLFKEVENLKEEFHGVCHTLMEYGLDV